MGKDDYMISVFYREFCIMSPVFLRIPPAAFCDPKHSWFEWRAVANTADAKNVGQSSVGKAVTVCITLYIQLHYGVAMMDSSSDVQTLEVETEDAAGQETDHVGAQSNEATAAAPDFEAKADAPPPPENPHSTLLKRLGALCLAAGLVVGVSGDFMFNGKLLGVSFLLFILLSIAIVVISAEAMHIKITVRNLWVVVPMLFFAGMVAVRTDVTTTFVNVVMTFYLGAMGIFYLTRREHIDEATISEHNSAAVSSGLMSFFASFIIIPHGLAFLFEAFRHREADQKMWLSIGRGLLIALPLLLVFGMLFASADQVFGQFFINFFQIFRLFSVSEWIEHGTVIAIIAWLASGAVAVGLLHTAVFNGNRPDAERGTSATKPKKHPFTLNMIEACIVLGMIDLLFGAFVLVQFRYFFGGETALQSAAISYAQYAQRGFAELMAVSALTLGVVLWLDWVTVRSGARQKGLFRGLATVLVALTTVILLSAANRMLLYEEAFGFTHLRVVVHIVIYWMAALFVAFLLSLYRVREHIFSLGVLVVIIGIAATINVIGLDTYMAERNIERFENGAQLDFAYLNTLTVDAARPILAYYAVLGTQGEETKIYGDYTLRDAVGQWLARRLTELEAGQEGNAATIFSANWARAEAYQLLNEARADLPAVDVNFYVPYGSDFNRGF